MTLSSSLLDRLRGGLVVSCQAYPGEPLRHAETMTQMAEAAVLGGAVGIRAQGLDDIRSIHDRVALPQIGLWKDGFADVFITPTLEHAIAVAEAGAEIVALDGTRRARPDGRSFAETVAALRDRTSALIMADVGSLDDGLAAEQAGVDCLSTTLCGYTAERPKTSGPDLEALQQLVGRSSLPVFAEGRVHSTEQAARCIEAGAHAVVVGTAITHPTTIAGWFAASIAAAQQAN